MARDTLLYGTVLHYLQIFNETYTKYIYFYCDYFKDSFYRILTWFY